MSSIVNSALNSFNNCVGSISYAYLSKRYATNTPLLPEVDTLEKAYVACRIKVAIYNVATVLAISSVVAGIFTGSIALIPLTVSLATMYFVHKAMEITHLGRISNDYQASMKRIFKSTIPQQ